MTRQYHLQVAPGDVAPYVLLPGDPGRVPMVAEVWDHAREVARNREYVTFTGTYQGVPISCTSTGIGSPSTAIAVEELARVGATTFVRIGTCGSLQPFVEIGDIAIFDAAVRADGASALYAPLEYPAGAHHDLVTAAVSAARRTGVRHHVGTTLSTDLFYVPEPGSAFGGYEQSTWRERWDDVRRMNVLAAEMETGVLLVLARIWGLRAGAIALVADDALEKTDTGAFDPQATFEVRTEHVDGLVRVGCETVRILEEGAASQPPGNDASP